MKSSFTAGVVGLCVLSAGLGATVAFARDRGAQSSKSRAPAKDAAPPPDVTDPEAYERELKAAQEQRDRDLQEAQNEKDRRKFEKRKEAIFAQYAAILTEMNERYRAAGGDAGGFDKSSRGKRPQPQVTERPGRPETKPETKKKPAAKPPESGPNLAELQKQLDDENARHDTAMADLDRQLRDAQSSGVKREIRKAERAIDKENSDYQSKKSSLEQQLKDLGGGTGTPSDDRRQPSGKSTKRRK